MLEKNISASSSSESIYYDLNPLLRRKCTFNFIFGARGCGKTFGFLNHFMTQGTHHLYLRRTQKELDLAVNKEVNPYISPGAKNGLDYSIQSEGDLRRIVQTIHADGKEPENHLMGFAGALSTFNNIRGTDFRHIRAILEDEFIPQNNARQTIKNEADAFFNMYESVNRNREIEGEDPVPIYCLSNAVSIASPILMELGLVPVIEMMIRKRQHFWTDPERSICINLADSRAFEDYKDVTALSRLTRGTKYYSHAVKNEFAYDSYYNVKRRDLVEYVPWISYNEVTIYRHKSNGYYYACFIPADCPHFNDDTKALMWRNYYPTLKEITIAGKLEFDSFVAKIVILEFLKMN